MSNYEQLIEKITAESDQVKTEGLRKLVYLSVNDPTNFRSHAKQIAESVNASLEDMFEEETKLLALQLLSELVSSYRAAIPKSTMELGSVVVCLSDEKLEIRKASHYLILTFVKKYEKFDEVLEGYRQVGEQSNISWKLIQKIIHSFESLVIHEPRCITYSDDYTNMDSFLTFVIKRVTDDNSLLKKASEQAMTSFVKNQYTPQILPKLNNYVSQTLINHSKTVGVNLPEVVQQEDTLEQVNISSTDIKKSNQEMQKVTVVHSPRLPSGSLSLSPTISVERKSSQLRLNAPDATAHQLNQRIANLLNRIQANNEWSVKCESMDELHRLLISESVKIVPDLLIERVMDLTSDLNFKTCVTSMNTVYYLVLECFSCVRGFLKNIEQILVDKMCDSKLAIRQISSKIVKELVCNHKSTNIMRLLMQKVANCSLLGKEQIIGLVQEIYTQEESDPHQDYLIIVESLASLLYNQNTKIKMKAIEALVRISLSTDLDQCKRVLNKKLNKVYYDMFLERLKDRSCDRWEDNKNKGASYQVERAPAFTFEKPFSTKKQSASVFGGDKQNFRRQHQDTLSINSRPQNQTFFYESKTTNKTMSSTNTETISASCKNKGYSEGKSTISTNFGEFTTSLSTNINTGGHEQKVNLIVRNKYSGTGYEQDDKKIKEEKTGSYQYKPTLPRKPPVGEEKKEKIGLTEEQPLVNNSDKSKEENLIVESREYRFKRPVQEEKPKQERKSNLKLTKPFSNKRQPQRVEEDVDEDEKRQLSKPFTKKSSKNEPRIIDYKNTQYIERDELKPFDNIDQALKQIVNDIRKEDDWSTHFEYLNSIRRVLKHHPQAYSRLIAGLPTTMPQVLKLVESLRSSLAKNAMMTLAEMCQSLKRSMDPYLQSIFPKLFRKGLDTNSFINDEVKKCLTSLCSYCTYQKIVPIILNSCQTKQTQVKLYIMLCIEKLTERYPSNRLQLVREYNKLATIIGSYVTDSSAEVRTCCKNLFCVIVRESPKLEVEGIFRRSTTEDSFTRLKNILEKEVLAADIVVQSSSKKRIDFE